MSARSSILGWVIRRLSEIDAAEPAARAALFDVLRTETIVHGACGLAPAEALLHLESAIARQDVYWILQQPPSASQPAPGPSLPPAQPPPPTIWQWPAKVRFAGPPPGPSPGEAVGPFADHSYQSSPLAVPGSVQELRLGWAFDPACTLTADCPAIGFHFRTRAATFADAIEHLAHVLAQGGLTLPEAAGTLEGRA